MITASAPGKLVIAGEYAVLRGAPAIAAAMNRRATVTLSPTDADHHRVQAPGLVDHTGCFQTGVDGVEWLDGAAGYELLSALWPASASAHNSAYEITLDSRALSDTSGQKLGLGSSAAVAVALAGALTAAGHEVDAAACHREFQGGQGSGVDIACSTDGGVIEFEGGRPRSVNWPENLGVTIYWSGSAASTRDKLSQLSNEDGATLRTLYRAAQDVAERWHAAEIDALLDSFSYYVRVLRAFDIDQQLGIFDAGHLELTDIAESMDMIYKPCGAGGGDLGILLSAAGTDTTLFTRQAEAAGFSLMDLAVDPDGLTVRQEGRP